MAHETVRNAISAATCDPRFNCVRDGRIGRRSNIPSMCSRPRSRSRTKANSIPEAIRGDRAGRGRRGLLLPDLEGVDTVDFQISIAMQKAGITAGTRREASQVRSKTISMKSIYSDNRRRAGRTHGKNGQERKGRCTESKAHISFTRGAGNGAPDLELRDANKARTERNTPGRKSKW